MEDDLIIERVKAGDAQAFSLLVEKYQGSLLSFIFRLTGDEKIVEDLGQDVFLEVYRSLKHFDPGRGTPFSAWLFISARNRCISELRKRKNAAAVPIDEVEEIDSGRLSAEELMIRGERRRMAGRLVDELAEPLKRPLVMSLRGDSLKEIAAACGISQGTVKSRLSRAKEKLRLLDRGHGGGKGYERV